MSSRIRHKPPPLSPKLWQTLPGELIREILNFTSILQMREACLTNDLDRIAKGVCRHVITTGSVLLQRHCWVVALLDFGLRISDPIESSKIVYNHRYPGRAWSVFHVAAMVGDIRLIRRLVHLGYNINAVCGAGRTAVFSAAVRVSRGPASNYLKILVLNTLCQLGADLNYRNDGEDSNIIREWITRCPRMGFTSEERIQVLKLFLKHGALLSQGLHGAAQHNANALFVKALLEAGADIEEKFEGKTPLTTAVYRKSHMVVQALVDAGAQFTGQDLFRALDPHPAGRVADDTIAATLSVLLKAGADVNYLDSDNHSLLSYALTVSRRGNLSFGRNNLSDVVKVLCEQGANVNLRHYNVPALYKVANGDTPLHIAVSLGGDSSSKCVKVLISHGANVNIRNDALRTSMDLAKLTNDHRCLRVFERHRHLSSGSMTAKVVSKASIKV